MPLNPSLILGPQEPQVDPLQVMQQVQNLRVQREQAGALAEQRQAIAEQRRAQTDQLQREQEEAEALKTEGFNEDGTPNYGKIYRILGPERGAKAAKLFIDLQKQKYDTEEAGRKGALASLDGIAVLPEGMRNEAWKLRLARWQQLGVDVSELPPDYSPEAAESVRMELLTPKEREEIQHPRGVVLNAGDRLTNPVSGAEIASVPKPEADPTNIEAAILAARKAGNPQEVNRLVKLKAQLSAAGRAPESDKEPLVAIIGPDGQSVLVPRSQAVGKRPANAREQGRPVTSGDAGRIADFDTSLDDLAVLRQTVAPKKDAQGRVIEGPTGTSAAIGAALPNAVTDLTGLGAESKAKQAVIDRVKQVIGKALEGGVLRKEDEYKYTKILPTIGDTATVVEAKLRGLQSAIEKRRVTQIDALEDAGYDVSKYRARAPHGQPPQDVKNTAGPKVRERRMINGQLGEWDGKGWKAVRQ